jgi:hypothetical protein
MPLACGPAPAVGGEGAGRGGKGQRGFCVIPPVCHLRRRSDMVPPAPLFWARLCRADELDQWPKKDYAGPPIVWLPQVADGPRNDTETSDPLTPTGTGRRIGIWKEENSIGSREPIVFLVGGTKKTMGSRERIEN